MQSVQYNVNLVANNMSYSPPVVGGVWLPPAPFAPSDLNAFAQDRFFGDTGIHDPGFAPGTPPANYTSESRPASSFETRCWGGARASCNTTAWLPSVAGNPTPVTWQTVPVDQLITDDATLSAAMEQAIKAYIDKANAAWQAVDICPVCNPTGGTCSGHQPYCDCIQHSWPKVAPWLGSHPTTMGNGCHACIAGWYNPLPYMKGNPRPTACTAPVCNPSCPTNLPHIPGTQDDLKCQVSNSWPEQETFPGGGYCSCVPMPPNWDPVKCTAPGCRIGTTSHGIGDYFCTWQSPNPPGNCCSG